MKTFLVIVTLMTGFSRYGLSQDPASPSLAETKTEALDFTTSDEGEHLLYRQYAPDVEAGKKYPLLVFLHGYGERGTDNRKQLRHAADDMIKYIESHDQPAFFILPQCPPDMRWVRYVRPITNPPHRMDRYPTLPLQMVEKLIESKMEELPIDPRRIYVAGLSMGGFATWELLSRRPDLFAAGIPICGGGDPAMAKRFKDVPIWAFHGGADGVVSPAYSTMMIDALKKAGAREPKYTEYPGVGHNSWTETCRDVKVLDWLFGNAKGQGELRF
jgi:predicted peptidase